MFFDKAYKETLNNEGLYSDDVDDFGGETFMGISRRFNSDWRGWILIDILKKSNDNFPQCLKDNESLIKMAKGLYKERYWDKFKGDYIKSEIIAMELFDTSVNMSTNRAVKFLQIGLNCLNRQEKLYKNILEDGIMGKNTLDTLDIYLKLDDDNILYKMMNILQGYHYISLMKEHESQEKYARGWFKRVNINKEI